MIGSTEADPLDFLLFFAARVFPAGGATDKVTDGPAWSSSMGMGVGIGSKLRGVVVCGEGLRQRQRQYEMNEGNFTWEDLRPLRSPVP